MKLQGMTVGLIIADGYHEHELWFPYYRFREEGAQVLVAGPELGTVYGEGRHGKDGLPAEVTLTVQDLADADADLIYIPGGIWAPLTLRHHQPTLDLVRRSMAAGTLVATICHSAWVLVSADVVRGRRLTCPPDMAVDVTNAGGVYVDQPAVRDGNLITAVYFGYLPEHFHELMPALLERA